MASYGVLLTTIVYVSSATSYKFPWKDPFNHSSVLESIKRNYLCSSSSTSRHQSNKCCECTEECLKYKTCCIDNLWNVERPVRSKEYLDLLINVTSTYKDTSCEPIFPVTIQNKLNHTSENILMVSECLNHASHIDREGCKESSEVSFDSIMPVFGSDQYIYKNAFCARCNFIKHFLFVNLTAKCEVNKRNDKKLYQRLVNCSFKITPTNNMKNHIKPCVRNIFDDRSATCNRTNKYYKMCSSYLGVVRNKKNYYCLLCNGTITKKVSKILPRFLCPKYVEHKSVAEDKNLNKNLSQCLLSITFSEQTSITIKGIKHSSKHFCGSGEVYNIISSECQEFSCLKGYKKSGNGCFKDQGLTKSTQTPHRNNFDRCLTRSKIFMIASMYPFEKKETSSVEVLKMIFKIALPGSQIHLGTTYNNSYRQISLNIMQNQLKLILNTLTSRESSIWVAVDRVYLTSLLSETFKKVATKDFTKDFKDGHLCAEAKTINKIPIDFMQNCSFVLHNKIFNMSNTNLLVEINRLAWKRKLVICSEFYLRSNCTLKEVTNYILFENKTLKVGNILYSTSQYIPFNGSFGICIPKNNMTYNFVFPNKWLYYLVEVSKYISFSGSIVSIVCYFIIIIVYQFTKVVKSSSTAAIIFQCVTLLVTDTTFLVAVHMRNHHFACKLMGMFLHWGLLASQLWTTVISFDLLLKVRSVSISIIKANTVRIGIYCIVAYLIPTVIVSTTVLLDMYQIINMGYGENDICLINDYHSYLYFVTVPFATMFLLTILFLTHCLFCLWKRERKARRVLQNSGRRNNNLLSIAFKLTLALGLIEFIGLIRIRKKDLTQSELVFNTISLVLFIILRSLRGLWLFLIFGCNQKNIKLSRPIWMKKSKT